MDFEKISSYDFMIKVFTKYHRQLLKELDKEYRRRDDIDPPAYDIIREHLADYHSVIIVRPLSMDHADTNDPPTRLSSTMEPCDPGTCDCCVDVVKWRDHWHRKWEAAELELYEMKKAYNAMCGPRAHQLGCDCGGKNNSGYTCKQFHDLMKKD